MIPAAQPRCRTAKDSTGVGSARGSTWTANPAPASTAAEIVRELVGAAPGVEADRPRRRRRARTRPASRASPAAARVTTAAFMPAGPARSGPRSPAVPKVSGPANRRLSSAVSPAAISASISAPVAGVRIGVRPGARRAPAGRSREPAHEPDQELAQPPGRAPCRPRAPPGGPAPRRSCPAAALVTIDSPNTSRPGGPGGDRLQRRGHARPGPRRACAASGSRPASRSAARAAPRRRPRSATGRARGPARAAAAE